MATTKDTAQIAVGHTTSLTDGDVAVPLPIETTEQMPRKQPIWRRVLGIFWDTVEGDTRDRRYIQKLETYLL